MKSFFAVLFVAPLLAQNVAPIRFEERTLGSDLKSGYQMIAVDVNHDGRLDLVALASGLKDLYWFENPSWERRVLATGLNRMINVAPLDADGDGIPEFLVAHEFANVAKNSIGIVSLLEHGADVRQPWKVREIDRIPTSHRMRTIRLAKGARAIVNAPLTDAKAEPPDYRGHVPVVMYRPPEWKRELIGDSVEGVMHGVFVFDWDGDGVDELLTAIEPQPPKSPVNTTPTKKAATKKAPTKKAATKKATAKTAAAKKTAAKQAPATPRRSARQA